MLCLCHLVKKLKTVDTRLTTQMLFLASLYFLMSYVVLQDILLLCSALIQTAFLAALLAEHKAAKEELRVYQATRDDLEPLLPFEQGIAAV